MLNLIFIIIASLIPLAVTWITSPEEIFIVDEKQNNKQIFKKKARNKLSKKGIWFIAAIVLTILFAFIQFSQNEKDKSDLKAEREKSETMLTNRINFGVDSSRKILFKDLSEALAKQNLSFDSSQKIIQRLIKDSSKRVSNIVTIDEPSLMLNTNPVTLDSSNGN